MYGALSTVHKAQNTIKHYTKYGTPKTVHKAHYNKHSTLGTVHKA